MDTCAHFGISLVNQPPTSSQSLSGRRRREKVARSRVLRSSGTWTRSCNAARQNIRGGPFFLRFFVFFKRIFCFSGWVAFRLFGFYGFYVGFCGFSFRILCIHSSSLFASSALPAPLRQVAFWLCGFWRLSGFGFFASSAFPVGFLVLASCILSIASSSLVPRHPPFDKIHA